MLFFSSQRRLLEIVVVRLPHSSSCHQRGRPTTGRTKSRMRRGRLPLSVRRLPRGVLLVVVTAALLSLCSLWISLLVHGFHQQRFPFFAFSKISIRTSSSLSLSGPYYVELGNNIKNSKNNHFELASPVSAGRRHDDDHHHRNGDNDAVNILNGIRTRDDVTFLSPLLKYGYRPAVDEYEERLSDAKPLLLYLPGFDGTFLAPFLQFPELGTIFEVQCMTISTTDRSTFDELKETVVKHLLRETTDFEQRQQERRRLEEEEQLANQDRERQQQQQIQQKSGGGGVGGFLGLFGRSKSPTTDNTSSISNSIDNSGVFNLFGWWSSGNTTASNSTTTIAIPTGTANTTVSSSSSSNIVNNGSGSTSRKITKAGPSRPIYLAGESFGGILACEVSLELLARHQRQQQNYHHQHVNLQGLALINPATCYDRSRLAVEAPIVAEQFHPLLYPVALATKVLPLFLDEYSFAQLLLILQARALPSVIDNAIREAYMGRVAFSLPFVIQYLDQSTLRWRLKKWLEVGCERMAVKLKDFQKYSTTTEGGSGSNFRPLPILIVAGEKDRALPSIAEAERLSSILPKTFLHVVEGAGHSSTCGSRVDLAALFRATYPELRRPPSSTKGKGRNNNNNNNNDKRTSSKTLTTTKSSNRIAMKKVAASGKNEYFGMEPRYDNSTTIGLSPLLYWSEDFYRKFRPRLSQKPVRDAVATATNYTEDSSNE